MSVSVVIAAGGTGGHLSPALALAEALRELRPDIRVCFAGARRGMEGTMVPAAGYRLHALDVLPFARTLGLRRYLAPFALLRASAQARAILRAERAGVVVGMGGYPSLPVVAAARWLRIPSIVHEQNAAAGIANRAAAYLTRNVALAFGEAARGLPRFVRPRTIGMPLRVPIASFDRAALREEAMEAFDLDPGRATVLVAGGSLGAARLNAAAVGMAARWRDRDDLQMIVSAGRSQQEDAGAALDGARGQLPVRCVAFIERMDLAYAAADVALCRAGAATIAELAATGVPSVLVPYPHARGGHQAANAAVLERAGGAVVRSDAAAEAGPLATLIEGLLADPARRAAMGAAARSTARPAAASALAAWALDLAEAGRSGRRA
ncbi:MAG: undecaprenyldiphospho-muramoylpentapeptide beta-N-acetylglucosaminyltransferase [Acidobacteria bacterium]|nr:undecaprenyldiphospho-muramoylpentapeptide beta-N-acetylglucosaminyltransferase [Acidobacteriota bacterium]